jgi:hypothetical protein
MSDIMSLPPGVGSGLRKWSAVPVLDSCDFPTAAKAAGVGDAIRRGGS